MIGDQLYLRGDVARERNALNQALHPCHRQAFVPRSAFNLATTNRLQRMVEDAAGGRVAVSETLPQCTSVNVTFLMHLALYRRAGGTREHAYPDCIPVALTAARCGDQVCDPVCGRQLTSARPH